MRKIAGFTTTRSIILEILNHVVRKENESRKVSVIKVKLLLFVHVNFLIQKFQKSTEELYEAIRKFS